MKTTRINLANINRNSIYFKGYKPRTHKEFNDVLKMAEPYLENLPKAEQEKYETFKKKIHLTKEGEANLHSTDTLKAYLAFKKLLKYKGNLNLIKSEKIGIHNENSPFLGEYAKSYEDFYYFVSKSGSKIQKTYRNLYNAIYTSKKLERFKMLEKCDFEEAFSIGREMLDEEKKAHNISPNQKVTKETTILPDAVYGRYSTNVCKIIADDNANTDWQSIILVDKYSRMGPLLFPRPLIKLHEIYHVKQIKPGEIEKEDNYLQELGATIDTIVKNDEIYKKLNNISQETIVYYRPMAQNQRGKSFNLGEFANIFRTIKTIKNLRSYEEVLITPEAIRYLQNDLML